MVGSEPEQPGFLVSLLFDEFRYKFTSSDLLLVLLIGDH